MYKKPKYRNIKVEYDGYKFDSKRERDRYIDLKLLERAGHISNLVIQPEFPFTVNGKPLMHREQRARQLKYIADFSYTQNGVDVVEDVKSPATAMNDLFRIKKALFETLFDKKLTVVY